MDKARPSAVTGRYLAGLWASGTFREVEDSELLARYVQRRDDRSEAAFRALVERHGAMVLNVCRQVLGDPHDAQDSAQAVFLILARKAGSIRNRGSVAPWLHGVARRVASRARLRAGVRRSAEARTLAAVARPEAIPSASETGVDWEVVHDEVARLPEKYRALVVLCYLEGLTYEEAARRAGCPVGTVRVRLSRARDRLRSRLERRGIESACLVPLRFEWLAGDPNGPAGPSPYPGWVDATVQSSLAFASGQSSKVGAVSATVLRLSQEVLMSMMISNVKLPAFGLFGLGLITMACSVLWGQERRDDLDPPPLAKVVDPSEAGSAGLRQELARVLVEAAISRLDAQWPFYREGRITIDRYIDASRQVRDAQLRLAKTKDQRVSASRLHIQRLAAVLNHEMDGLRVGRGTIANVTEAEQAIDLAAVELYEAESSAGTVDVRGIELEVRFSKQRREEVQRLIGLHGAPKGSADPTR